MPTHVSAIAAMRNGKLLMGKRRDSQKWAAPGGHVEGGETPHVAAHRELREETGLRAESLKKRGTTPVKDGSIHVHAFHGEVGDGEPHAKNDPDKEFSEFRWVDPKNLPHDVKANLHNKPDVILDLFKSAPKKTPYGAFDQLMQSLPSPQES